MKITIYYLISFFKFYNQCDAIYLITFKKLYLKNVNKIREACIKVLIFTICPELIIKSPSKTCTTWKKFINELSWRSWWNCSLYTIVGTEVILIPRARVLSPLSATKYGPLVQEHVAMSFHGIPVLLAHWNRKSLFQEIYVHWWRTLAYYMYFYYSAEFYQQ